MKLTNKRKRNSVKWCWYSGVDIGRNSSNTASIEHLIPDTILVRCLQKYLMNKNEVVCWDRINVIVGPAPLKIKFELRRHLRSCKFENDEDYVQETIRFIEPYRFYKKMYIWDVYFNDSCRCPDLPKALQKHIELLTKEEYEMYYGMIGCMKEDELVEIIPFGDLRKMNYNIQHFGKFIKGNRQISKNLQKYIAYVSPGKVMKFESRFDNEIVELASLFLNREIKEFDEYRSILVQL